ncbi:MAG TPA: hypothetical protein VFX28_00245, partial [Methylomirabilota bacterium]|nr:hypothetical protein [Methylomirabilota bacterium]
FIGLLAWAAVAVVRRGHGAIYALPVSLAAACAAGVGLPLAGLDDATGLLLSLVTALAGSFLGYAVVLALLRRFAPAKTAPPAPSETPPRE